MKIFLTLFTFAIAAQLSAQSPNVALSTALSYIVKDSGSSSSISLPEEISTGQTLYSTETSEDTRPATMQGFNAAKMENRIMLNWSIPDNAAARIFEVQRSLDGAEFKVVGVVLSSEKFGEEQYAFQDIPRKQDGYYRLRLVDNRQREFVSKPVFVKATQTSLPKHSKIPVHQHR